MAQLDKTRKVKRTKKPKARSRRISLRLGIVLFLLTAAFAGVSCWFVRHPEQWRREAAKSLPDALLRYIYSTGNVVADLTDSLDLTGEDTIYEYDIPAPAGEIFFAGAPVRMAPPAPDDIVILRRKEFAIGWSPSLKHPVWCAYHVKKDANFPTSRTSFRRDAEVPTSPNPSDYEHSGFDRGHMVPNYAIVTRYGTEAQKQTFRMTNIVPQTPQLNRGVWKDLEHRIADLWTARYGEIWVIVGSIHNTNSSIRIGSIEIPDSFYQLIVAQEGMDVRALAVLLPQKVEWNEYAARHLISIDELERLSGMDFLPELPTFIQSPLEAQLPTRLWPIRLQDAISLLLSDLRR